MFTGNFFGIGSHDVDPGKNVAFASASINLSKHPTHTRQIYRNVTLNGI